MDKLIEKLSEILSKLGLDETQIAAVVDELSKVAVEESAEENPEDGDPAASDGASDEVTQPEDVTPGDGASDVPPSDELPPDEGTPVPPEGELPPAEVPPAQPPVDLEPILARVSEVENANAELKAANEGLLARVQSLEEALKSAGVIDNSPSAGNVGDQLPGATPQSPTDDVLGDVMSELNGHKRF